MNLNFPEKAEQAGGGMRVWSCNMKKQLGVGGLIPEKESKPQVGCLPNMFSKSIHLHISCFFLDCSHVQSKKRQDTTQLARNKSKYVFKAEDSTNVCSLSHWDTVKTSYHASVWQTALVRALPSYFYVESSATLVLLKSISNCSFFSTLE